MEPTRELLSKCRLNDRKAHHELYVMCFPVIYSVCSRYHHHREDRMSALNMIFLRLIQNMDAYLKKHHHVPYEQWLRRVSVNYIIDEFRKQKKYRELIQLQESLPDHQQVQQPEAELKYDNEELLQVINRLPPASRAVFNLYAVDGFKHEEIAGMLGISAGTSKAHLFKARKLLKELLEDMHHKSPALKNIAP